MIEILIIIFSGIICAFLKNKKISFCFFSISLIISYILLIYFYSDQIGIFFSTIFLLIFEMIGIYSFSSFKYYHYSLLSFAAASMIGISFARDLFLIYVLLELQFIPIYFVLALRKKADSLEASIKYLFMNIICSSSILLGISLIYAEKGNVLIQSLSNIHPISFALLICGIAIKIGIFPFHTWVPDVYQTSLSGISAVFSSIFNKIGIIILIRIIQIFSQIQWSWLLILISSVSMTYSNLVAITQSNVKRMLAYSSIANMSYILFGISTFSKVGVFFHIFSHSFLICSLFMLFGLFSSEKINSLKGIGKSNKVVGFCLLVNLIAACSIPPFAIFFSEFFLTLGTLSFNLILPFILISNFVISCVYYINLIKIAFLEEGEKYTFNSLKTIPIVVCTIIQIIIPFIPQFIEFISKIQF